MLEIAESNSETSNNSISLAAVTLAISVAKLVAITLAILITITPLKLATLVVLIIAAPFKRGAYKAAGGRAANSAS